MALSNEIDITVEQLAQNPVTIAQDINTDYNILENKPKINNVTVEWSKNGHDYNLANLSDLEDFEDEANDKFVSKTSSPTLNGGDGYSFNFETNDNQQGHVELTSNWGLEMKHITAGSEINLRPEGNIEIQSAEGQALEIKQKGSNGAIIELKGDNAVQIRSGEGEEVEIKQKGSTGAKFTLTTSNGIAMQVASGEDVTINNSHVVTTNDKATSSSLGVVQVDGSTITVDSDGVISATQSGGGTWGSITGTLSDQTDLNNELTTLSGDIDDIEDLIPAQATDQNQLADKNFVNSSVATNTANFIGTFNSVAELEAYSGTLTNNDYAFVVGTDSAGNTVYNRYKYTTVTTPASWIFEYALNNSSFTAEQWAAINSGITNTAVAQIATNTAAIATKLTYAMIIREW